METVGHLLRDASPELAPARGSDPRCAAYALDLPVPARDGPVSVGWTDHEGAPRCSAGPGVLRDRAVDGLRARSPRPRTSALRTPGAPRASSTGTARTTWGPADCRRDDFKLLGFAGLDLLWAVGLDPAESPPDRTSSARRSCRSQPADLAPFATQRRAIVVPDRRRRRCSSGSPRSPSPGTSTTAFPRHPARAVMDIKQRMAPGASSPPSPGPAGLWVARTFPTDAPGTVVVPAVDGAGHRCRGRARRRPRRADPRPRSRSARSTTRLAAVLELADRARRARHGRGLGRRRRLVADRAARRRGRSRRSVDDHDERPHVAVVTGASIGIGRAHRRRARRARAGGRARRPPAPTSSTRPPSSCIEAGGEAFPIGRSTSPTPPRSTRSSRAAEDALGSVDALVNNAGVAVPGPFWELDPEQLEREVRTNLLGPMLCTRRVLRPDDRPAAAATSCSSPPTPPTPAAAGCSGTARARPGSRSSARVAGHGARRDRGARHDRSGSARP